MQKTELDDRILLDAVDEMERGLIDADLGGGVYKKRIALPGRGKRGSTRTLIATNREIGGYFSLVLKKMSEVISHKKSYAPGK